MTASGSDPPAGHAGGPGRIADPTRLLADLPEGLWPSLLRAVRRAVERIPRSELPTGLRPYAGWTPDSLAAPRPRGAVARALAGEPRLREALGETLDEALVEAVRRGGARASRSNGEDDVAAGLVALGRWDDLAVLAAEAAERAAADRCTAAESVDRSAPATSGGGQGQVDELRAELAAARLERDTQRRRADAAEQRLRAEATTREGLAEQLAQQRAKVEERERALVEERRRRDRRVARLHRRVEDAESRARVDDARARAVAGELEDLASRLRAALAPPAASDEAAAPPPTGDRGEVPRTVRAAEPGRPCQLPPGVVADSTAGVHALLQVPGIEVLVDGYNVTLDPRGRPGIGLPEQRQWLVKLAAQVAARFGCRPTVVFDGSDVRAPLPAGRGVRVVFTEEPEIADERILLLLQGLDASTPVLVVSSDREVRSAAAERSADTVGADQFLAAVDG